MSARIDLEGLKFGRLTVVSFSQTDRSGRGHWICLCSCGNASIVLGSQLRSGRKRSCGCLRVDSARHRPGTGKNRYTECTGYIKIRDPEGKRKWIREHVLIAENILKRRLKKGEMVHHIDLQYANNKNSNLLICDKSYHRWLHSRYAERFGELHLRG